MKQSNILLVLAISALSCSNESDSISNSSSEILPEIEYLDSHCVDEMNAIFQKVKYSIELPKIDSISTWEPNLLRGYQDREYHEQDHFLQLVIGDTTYKALIEIDPINLGEYFEHNLYFCHPIDEYWYIDYFTHIKSNFGFLNDCGLIVKGLTNDTTTSYAHSRSSALYNDWKVDSSTIKPKFNSLSFLESGSLITEIENIRLETEFDQYGSFIMTKDTSHFKLYCLILDENQLVIQDKILSQQINTYYLSPR